MVVHQVHKEGQENKQMQQSNTQSPAFDIEGFITELFISVKLAVVTLRDLAVHPARVSKGIKMLGREKRHLGPFTCLVLTSFVYIFAIRNALIYNSIWERGETFVKEGIDYSNLILPYPELSDFLRLPSFTDILLIGVPIILTNISPSLRRNSLLMILMEIRSIMNFNPMSST